MAFSFMPKEAEFFTLFEKLAERVLEASHFFKQLAENNNFDDEKIARMRDIEHAADDITHDIFNKLNKTFITPFDREDIHSLGHELDGILDLILTMSNRMNLYKLREYDKNLVQFAELILTSSDTVAKAVKELRDLKKPQAIIDYCIEINRIENLGDQLRNSVIATLFESSDPIYIIKWKEIYELAETVLDQCEDVANIVESIIVKQA